MAIETEIAWTDSTFNPWWGCVKVSDGCDNCYAMTMARRLKAMGQAKYQKDGNPATSGPGFGVSEHPDTLTLPLKWRKPRKVFVNSMSDLFHKDVSDEFIAKVWAVMAATPQHTYQILTKRSARMRSLLSSTEFDLAVADAWSAMGMTAGSLDGGDHTPPYPLPNVHLGVSAEDQKWADIRIPHLMTTPAAVRWVSAEPLLGPIDFTEYLFEPGDYEWVNRDGLDWVVVGGESGRGARPMDLAWASLIVEQFRDAGVPVLVKQLGSAGGRRDHQDITTFPADLQVRQYPGATR